MPGFWRHIGRRKLRRHLAARSQRLLTGRGGGWREAAVFSTMPEWASCPRPRPLGWGWKKLIRCRVWRARGPGGQSGRRLAAWRVSAGRALLPSAFSPGVSLALVWRPACPWCPSSSASYLHVSSPFLPRASIPLGTLPPCQPRVTLQLGTRSAPCPPPAWHPTCTVSPSCPASPVSPSFPALCLLRVSRRAPGLSQQLPPGRLRPSLLARRVSWVCAPRLPCTPGCGT